MANSKFAVIDLDDGLSHIQRQAITYPSDEYLSIRPLGINFIEIHDDVIKWKYFPRYRPLCVEFTGPRWIPLTKASDAELWRFFICALTNSWTNNGDACDLRRHGAHCDVTVMESVVTAAILFRTPCVGQTIFLGSISGFSPVGTNRDIVVITCICPYVTVTVCISLFLHVGFSGAFQKRLRALKTKSSEIFTCEYTTHFSM